MTLQMLLPLLIAIIVGVTGCAQEKRRTTSGPARDVGQSSVSSSSASPERAKKPQASPPQESPQHKSTPPPAGRKDVKEPEVVGLPPREREKDITLPSPSVTPLDQSQKEGDLAVTQRIRQALMHEDLSFAAKNVLVITEGDHVVLKGPVRSSSEAERIKGIAGTITTKRIEDALEVTP
jgi:BON domain